VTFWSAPTGPNHDTELPEADAENATIFAATLASRHTLCFKFAI
jgi:hypothetical protein